MASDTVVQAFWTGFRRAAAEVATNLRAGVEAANAAVRAKQQSDAALAEMGSTLVAALVPGQRLYWASMGDSGLWLFRAGQMRRLNEDHSMRPLLFDLVELGRMTREEALADPRAHHLRSAITGRDLPPVEIAADGYRLKADDVVLLASDGLEVLSEARISGLNAQRGTDARGLARALLDAVDEASGQDNLDPRQHGSARSLISAPVGRLLASVNLSLPLVETECPSLEEETRRQLAQARQEQVQALQRARAAAAQRVRQAQQEKEAAGQATRAAEQQAQETAAALQQKNEEAERTAQERSAALQRDREAAERLEWEARQQHRRTLRSASIIGGLLLIGILGTLWSKRRRLRAAEAATRRMQSALSEVSARDRLRSSAPNMFLEGTRPPVALKIPALPWLTSRVPSLAETHRKRPLSSTMNRSPAGTSGSSWPRGGL